MTKPKNPSRLTTELLELADDMRANGTMDEAPDMTKTVPVTVRLQPDLNDQVAAIATAFDRPESWIIEQAVKDFVAGQAWQLAAIDEGIRAADAGRVVAHDEVAARVKSWGRPAGLPMKNPPHPGLSVRLDCLEPLGLSVTEGAKMLGVTRQALNNLVNGKSGILPDMAIRLEKAGWSNAETWLGVQMAYDLWQAKKHADAIKVKRYPSPR